jgi:hypothetical protein
MSDKICHHNQRLRRKRAKKHTCQYTRKNFGIIAAVWTIIAVLFVLADFNHEKWVRD